MSRDSALSEIIFDEDDSGRRCGSIEFARYSKTLGKNQSDSEVIIEIIRDVDHWLSRAKSEIEQ